MQNDQKTFGQKQYIKKFQIQFKPLIQLMRAVYDNWEEP